MRQVAFRFDSQEESKEHLQQAKVIYALKDEVLIKYLTLSAVNQYPPLTRSHKINNMNMASYKLSEAKQVMQENYAAFLRFKD